MVLFDLYVSKWLLITVKLWFPEITILLFSPIVIVLSFLYNSVLFWFTVNLLYPPIFKSLSPDTVSNTHLQLIF